MAVMLTVLLLSTTARAQALLVHLPLDSGAKSSRVVTWSGGSSGPRFELRGNFYSRIDAGNTSSMQNSETEKNTLRERTEQAPDDLQPRPSELELESRRIRERLAALAAANSRDSASDAGLDEVLVANINVAGEWVRRESNNNPNDGMRITISDGQAVLTYVPPTASNNWHEGEIVWRKISSKGTLQVLGSNNAYYNAEIIVETADIVHIDIDANGRGNDQSWQRANSKDQ